MFEQKKQQTNYSNNKNPLSDSANLNPQKAKIII